METTADNLKIGHGEVVVKSQTGHKFTQKIRSENHSLIADEPLSVGGEDLGMAPYELLLSSLGACTSMTLQMYAQHKNWPLTGVEVRLKHEKIHAQDCASCETKVGKIDKITKQIKIEGDLNAEQIQKLLEIAEKCPVNRTLKSEIWIETIH